GRIAEQRPLAGDFRNGGAIRRHDGGTASHGLDERHAEALLERGKDEHGAAAIELDQPRSLAPAEERDGRRKLERTNPTAQLRLILLIYGLPRNGESDVRTRLSEDGEGFDQRDEVLLNVEIADGEDERGGRARLFRRREVGIDAVMDDRRAAFR